MGGGIAGFAAAELRKLQEKTERKRCREEDDNKGVNGGGNAFLEKALEEARRFKEGKKEAEGGEGKGNTPDEGGGRAIHPSLMSLENSPIDENAPRVTTEPDVGKREEEAEEEEEGGERDRGTEAGSSGRRVPSMLQGCRRVESYEKLNRIDEGTYGVVYRARDKSSGEVVALKRIKLEKFKDGFPLTSIREINILLKFHHPNIVNVSEVVVGNAEKVFMVMEYMEHDLKVLLHSAKHRFSRAEVKCLMSQLLAGVAFLHENWIIHRDLKTSNILYNNRGQLKICDFGLARQYGSPLKPYTTNVVTLWYRAPELLLGVKVYSEAIDMWSVGCIMGELLLKEPLLPAQSELAQLEKMIKLLGTPNEDVWKGFNQLPMAKKFKLQHHPYSQLRKKFPVTSFDGRPTLTDAGYDLLTRLLCYDPEQRMPAGEAVSHPWFSESPRAQDQDLMPTFPALEGRETGQREGVDKSADRRLEAKRREELAAHLASNKEGGIFNFAL